MRNIIIDQDLKGKVPGTELLCIECDVVMQEPPAALCKLIEAQAINTRASLAMEEISQMPSIRASRTAYKATGKDPARYRLSAEALLRRIVKGEELYKISNVVDLLNLVSFTTGFSIGGYDAVKIEGPVRFGIGREGEPYTGIGRGVLNIEGLPVFRDERGAFGSPTSDSERTCVDWNTKRFLMVIINFGTNGLLADAGEMAVRLLLEFAEAKNMDIQTIK